jgi:uncharacterized protein (TIGR04255 family)
MTGTPTSMSHVPTNTPLPSYKHPPVNELSFGVVFQQLGGFQTRHFGQFWSEHQSDYPTTEDQSPLLDISEVEAQRLVLIQIPPLRRAMWYSQDQQYVAQLQDSRVYLNWRKLSPEVEYPRFAAVYSRFERLWSEFVTFVEREKAGAISTLRYELAYINHIELSDRVAESLEEHVKIFKFSPIEAAYVSPPESVNANWKFAMPNHRGTGTANLTNGKTQKGQNVLVLALTCSGTPSEKYSFAEWFESAHEWIVRSFTDLTTSAAHQKWQREK